MFKFTVSGEYKIKSINRLELDIKSIFVFLLSICYILEGISYSISSLSDFVGDNKKTIEIPERVLGFIV